MEYTQAEILQTVRMTEMEHLDIRTVTLGLSLRDCASDSVETTAQRVRAKIESSAARLVSTVNEIGDEIGIRIANAVEDNPFMAGAFHGIGEPEAVLNVGVSGPGVVNHAVQHADPEMPLQDVAELIKKLSFKLARAGELVGREAARRLDIPFGIIDLSLAPTPVIGDSVANIIEGMGFERAGTHGTTAALALLTDAVKKGGAMASNSVGGMSGAFIPVSEDAGMIEAAQLRALSLDKLEAWTSVCSVGIDMVAVPGSTSAETISAIIADEMAIGGMNNKTTAVRIIPVPGRDVGEMVEYGGLLGSAPIMPVNRFSSDQFIRRGGRIPAPVQSLRN